MFPSDEKMFVICSGLKFDAKLLTAPPIFDRTPEMPPAPFASPGAFSAPHMSAKYALTFGTLFDTQATADSSLPMMPTLVFGAPETHALRNAFVKNFTCSTMPGSFATPFDTHSPSALPTSFAFASSGSIAFVICVSPGASFGKMPPMRFAPTRPRDALKFFMAPENVLPLEAAAPPRPCSIAFWNCAKLILPLDARSTTCSAETPSSFDSICTTGMPASDSCAMTSPWILFDVATLLKIEPIVDMSVPAIVAASAVSFRVRSRSLPGFTPAAVAPAAVVAASPIPNAVPFTDAIAFFMIASTLDAELPRPVSFALASSIAVRRWKPFVRAVPTRPAPAAPAAPMPILNAPPTCEAIAEPIALNLPGCSTPVDMLLLKLTAAALPARVASFDDSETKPLKEGATSTVAWPATSSDMSPPRGKGSQQVGDVARLERRVSTLMRGAWAGQGSEFLQAPIARDRARQVDQLHEQVGVQVELGHARRPLRHAPARGRHVPALPHDEVRVVGRCLAPAGGVPALLDEVEKRHRPIRSHPLTQIRAELAQEVGADLRAEASDQDSEVAPSPSVPKTCW